MTNHIPVILAGLGCIAAIIALLSRKRVVWIYALTTLTLAGLSVYPVFFSGSQADKIVLDHDKDAKEAIHEHEAAADWALWMVLAAGVFSAYTLYRMRKNADELPPIWLRVLVVIAGLFAMSTTAVTALHGGEIRHAEWERSLTAPPPPDTVPKT